MKNIIKYFSEIFMLKRVKRNGWKLAGVPMSLCETIGEHEIVMAKIAYVLGEMEGLDPEKCALIALFHDDGEIRIEDQTKIASRYIVKGGAEMNALKDQVANLPQGLGEKIVSLVSQEEKRNTREGIVVKDADWLEVALQAKIYLEQGFMGCQDWIDNVEKALETKSAKEILAEIKKEEDFVNCWWRGLKSMTYKKLEKKR